MAKKIIYIHGGHGKTGTTSAQYFLYRNQRELGIFLPTIGLHDHGHHGLVNPWKYVPDWDEDETALFASLIDEIEATEQQIIVISSESGVGNLGMRATRVPKNPKLNKYV
jgi:hypothetical protein